MKRNTIYNSLLLVTLTLISQPSLLADTQYYRWQDPHGAWYFSDQPPNKIPSESSIIKIDEKQLNTAKPKITPPKIVPIKPTKQPKNTKKKIDNNKKRRLQKQKKACDRLKEKLNKIQNKLRAGYQEPKGNHLRKQRRDINSKIYHQC